MAHLSSRSQWKFPLWGLAFLSTLSVVNTASAFKIYPPDTVVYFEPSAIPSGGVIHGQFECYGQCDAPQYTIVNELLEPMPGRILDATADAEPGSFSWVAESPLPPGVYSLTVVAEELSRTGDFLVLEASDALPVQEAELHVIETTAGDPIYCENPEHGNPYFFYGSAQNELILTVSTSGLNVGQYSYTLSADGVVNGWSRGYGRLEFTGERSEVCYSVIARPLLGGENVSLGEECLSTEAFELAAWEELSSGADEVLSGCLEAPAGYFAEWCNAFSHAFTEEGACVVSGELDSCFAARRTCPEGDNPSAEEELADRMLDAQRKGCPVGYTIPSLRDFECVAVNPVDSAAGGNASDGGSSPAGSASGGAPVAESESNDAAEEEGDEERGCSFKAGQRSPAGSLWFFVALASLARLRRKREAEVPN